MRSGDTQGAAAERRRADQVGQVLPLGRGDPAGRRHRGVAAEQPTGKIERTDVVGERKVLPVAADVDRGPRDGVHSDRGVDAALRARLDPGAQANHLDDGARARHPGSRVAAPRPQQVKGGRSRHGDRPDAVDRVCRRTRVQDARELDLH